MGAVDGLVKLSRQIYDRISRHFDEAIETVVDVMHDPEARPAERLAAAKTLLDLAAKASGLGGPPGTVFQEAVGTMVLEPDNAEYAQLTEMVESDASTARDILRQAGDIEPDGTAPQGG